MNARRDFLRKTLLVGLGTALPAVPALAAGVPTMASNLDERNLLKAELFNPDIDAIRKLALMPVGELPTALNVLSVADTTRPANIVVKGADPKRKIKLERTAYQLQYGDDAIMLDSGMDEATANTFGKGGNFYQDKYQRLQQALRQARLIVLSHYHADHVGGVVTSEYLPELAPKVLATRSTAGLMVNKPHKPTIHLDKAYANQFIVYDYERYYPIAPGLVAIKAPGHSADAMMFYIRLKSGQEFIHSIDTGWSMENIIENKMKNASWIKEDEKQVMAQFAWLNKMMRQNPQLIVLSTHDADQYQQLRARGILGTI